MERNFSAKNFSRTWNPGITELRKLVTTEEGLPAFVQIFTEQPKTRRASFVKAFPDLRDAAKALIALKNQRKL